MIMFVMVVPVFVVVVTGENLDAREGSKANQNKG